MSCLFAQCYSLTSIGLSKFNTINVKNMPNMFQDCNQLKEIDVS